jgi:hypothetical protein
MTPESHSVDELTFPARFNGPAESGNGGYVSGRLAALVDGPAWVSLRSPAPLGRPLRLAQRDGGFDLLDGETLVAEARPGPQVDLEAPPPVSVEEARAATQRYEGDESDLFSRCFVCGPSREDSLGVFAGTVEGGPLVASPWTPPAWADAGDGTVRPEIVWAVLDCPTYFALYPGERPLSFLARMGARLDGPVRVGEQHVVAAWPVEKDGRKHFAGSAVLGADGRLLAIAEALLIQVGEGTR